ncbi:hypothetical protein ACR0ST_09925 [Aliidiomarina sp. Khilg15.8]
MKPTVLQRISFIVITLGIFVLGAFAAVSFLVLGLLFIPVFLIFVYVQRRAMMRRMKAYEQRSPRREHYDSQTIEGEVVKKRENEEKTS